MAIKLSRQEAKRLLGGQGPIKSTDQPQLDIRTATPGRIEFIVYGDPMGAPRMTRKDKWQQRDCVVRYRAAKDRIREAAGKIPEPSTIRSLSWVAFIAPPSSWSDKKRQAAMGTLHRSKPDRDNIDKGILDALFSEDSAIASGTIEKRWGVPARLEITIVLEDS